MERTRDQRIAEHVRGIKALMHYMNLPSTRKHMEDMTDAVLHIVSRRDPELDRMAIIIAAFQQALYVGGNGAVVVDKDLAIWANEEAEKLKRPRP